MELIFPADPGNGWRLEVKVCERCGGLWLRVVGARSIYCVACAVLMAECAPPRTELRKGARGASRRAFEREEAKRA